MQAAQWLQTCQRSVVVVEAQSRIAARNRAAIDNQCLAKPTYLWSLLITGQDGKPPQDCQRRDDPQPLVPSP